MRRFGDTYYFIYSSLNSHNLCYAYSDNPLTGFKFGGVLVSCGFKYFDLTNTKKIRINIKGNASGTVEVRNAEHREVVATISVRPAKDEKGFSAEFKAGELGAKDALFFTFRGKGAFNSSGKPGIPSIRMIRRTAARSLTATAMRGAVRRRI